MTPRSESAGDSLRRLARHVRASEELRVELARTSREVDAEGRYPFANMDLIAGSVVNELLFRESMGGAASEDPNLDLPAIVQIVKNIAAGESATAQIWLFSRTLTLEYTGPSSPVSAEAREKLIADVRAGARFCSPQAERTPGRDGGEYRLAIKKVDGGVLVNGDKYFATGSPGAKYGRSTGLMAGYESISAGGAHDVLFDLGAPGVTLVDDWDNMGQRATGSGQIHFEDVFVPDGWHWKTLHRAPEAVTGYGLSAVFLGIGIGCMDALVAHMSKRPMFPGIFEDSSIRYQIGRHQARLAAGEASLERAAERAVDFLRAGAPSERREAVDNELSQAKVAVVDAVLALAHDMQKFLGGQSTANVYGYDRFWRNVRTLSLQEPMDLRTQQVGAYRLRSVSAS